MAHLITCRVCGKNVSSEAVSCPHCGDPFITDEKKNAAEMAAKKKERLAHGDFLRSQWNRFCDSSIALGCPLCGKTKKINMSYNGNGVYWTPDCNCSMEDYFNKNGVNFGDYWARRFR